MAMMAVTVSSSGSGAGAKPRRAAVLRRCVSCLAALCLVVGQLHVWQHRAGYDGDHFDSGHSDSGHSDHSDHGHSDSGRSDSEHPGHGHSDSGAGDACQLADTPWTDIPAVFCAPDDASGPQRVLPAAAGAAGAGRAGTPPIRAPPHA